VSLLLHAITSPPEAPPADSTLRCLAIATDLIAWVTELGQETPSFSKEDLLEHHRRVSEVFDHVEACLPARFPTLVDAARLETFIHERQAGLNRQLQLVRGACELAITAAWTTLEEPTPVPAEVSPGRRYLLERQRHVTASERRHARAVDVAEWIEREVGDIARDRSRQVCPAPTVALSLALLVPRDQADVVKRRIPRVAPDVRILVNGPWPPYTFASVRSD
jgi:hypothetical protein